MTPLPRSMASLHQRSVLGDDLGHDGVLVGLRDRAHKPTGTYSSRKRSLNPGRAAGWAGWIARPRERCNKYPAPVYSASLPPVLSGVPDPASSQGMHAGPPISGI